MTEKKPPHGSRRRGRKHSPGSRAAMSGPRPSRTTGPQGSTHGARRFYADYLTPEEQELSDALTPPDDDEKKKE